MSSSSRNAMVCRSDYKVGASDLSKPLEEKTVVYSTICNVPEMKDLRGGPGKPCRDDFTTNFRRRHHKIDDMAPKTVICAKRCMVSQLVYVSVDWGR